MTFTPVKMDPLIAMFEQLPQKLQSKGGPADRAVGTAAEIGRNRIAQTAPSSAETGSRKNQSKKSRQAWPETLRDQIRTKVVYYPRPVAIIGAQYPKGNVAHFLQTRRRRHVLWGKASAVRGYRMTRNWIVRAMDETRSQQVHAMEIELRIGLNKVMTVRK
jgi:hypothetical protein